MSPDTRDSGARLPATVPADLVAAKEELVRWRHDLHEHPEIGFTETRTSSLVAERLAAFGVEVHTTIGGTGVVGVLRAGSGKRSIGLRADMDALPITEQNGFAHCSTNSGVMHACGHDGHTTMLLAAARHLAQTRNFDGCVHFIFQPAEEGLGGARAMMEQGLFERFPCESIYAMHNWPGMPVGQFGIRTGGMLAGGVFFDIEVKGRGAHGAFPHQSHDPVVAASELTMSLQSIVARRINPVEPAVVSVTRFHAGDAYNVIPHTATIGGTMRGFSNAMLGEIEQEMRRVATGVAAAHNVEATFSFRRIFAPLVNAERETALMADVAASLVGDANVNRNHHLIMGSEDFSFMMEARPGAFMLIGNGVNRSPVHSPTYDFNDDILPLGAALFAGVVERELAAA